MNRRGFLGAILASACAPAIVRFESLMPMRSLVMPTLAEVSLIGNQMLSPAIFAQEMLRILEKNIKFSESVTRKFDDGFAPSGGIIHIRRPQRFS